VSRPLYRLHVAPSEDEDEGEGEDHDQWFTSLRSAKSKRAKLIALDPSMAGHRYRADFQIDRVYLREDLSTRALALAILNRAGYVDRSEVVVEDYRPPTRQRRTDA